LSSTERSTCSNSTGWADWFCLYRWNLWY